MKKRIHYFTIRVAFDKPCTAGLALRAVREDGGIDAGRGAGSHYPTQYEDSEPGEFWVRSIKPMPGPVTRHRTPRWW